MEQKHNIIRNALTQAPGTQLPDGFTERLMNEVYQQSMQREQRKIRILIALISGFLAILITGTLYYVGIKTGAMQYFNDLSEKNTTVDFSELLQRFGFSDPAFHLYIFIALAFLGLSALDMYLRHRINRRSGNHRD